MVLDGGAQLIFDCGGRKMQPTNRAEAMAGRVVFNSQPKPRPEPRLNRDWQDALFLTRRRDCGRPGSREIPKGSRHVRNSRIVAYGEIANFKN